MMSPHARYGAAPPVPQSGRRFGRIVQNRVYAVEMPDHFDDGRAIAIYQFAVKVGGADEGWEEGMTTTPATTAVAPRLASAPFGKLAKAVQSIARPIAPRNSSSLGTRSTNAESGR